MRKHTKITRIEAETAIIVWAEMYRILNMKKTLLYGAGCSFTTTPLNMRALENQIQECINQVRHYSTLLEKMEAAES